MWLSHSYHLEIDQITNFNLLAALIMTFKGKN